MNNTTIHTTVGGFVAQRQPNVNAAYGPWDSKLTAKLWLESNYMCLDENMTLVPSVPVGTTVAIYDDLKQSVQEYWWINDDLVLKTYGANQYSLLVYDIYNKEVSSISINEGNYNSPAYLFPKTLKGLNEEVNIGTISYSIDGSAFIVYDKNTVKNTTGIPTAGVTQSLLLEWRDVDGTLLAYKDLSVHSLPTISLEFYSYNNDEQNSPEICAYLLSSTSYQSSDWSPNVYGDTSWSLTRKGVSAKNHIEWRVSRTRINGLWSELGDAYISGRWGQDGINAVDKLILYYYSPTFIESKLDIDFDTDLDWLGHNVSKDGELKGTYTCPNTGRTWEAVFRDVTPEDRYCYVTMRYKGIIDGQLQFGSWTTPAFYTKFAVDGKDGADVEYIYCTSTIEKLSDDALLLLESLNQQYSSKYGNTGGEINFDPSLLWTDDPSGINETTPYEFCSRRKKGVDSFGIPYYEEFEPPFIWASLGKEGPDGPGLEYIYILTSDSLTVPEIDCSKADPTGKTYNDFDYLPSSGDRFWSDDPLTVTPSLPVQWMSLRKGTKGKWKGDDGNGFSTPIIWNQFSYSYELRLSNDNCEIPAATDGSYTIAAANAATATEVELYLGIEKIDIVKEGITITCDNYIKIGNTYCLNKLIAINGVHIAVFEAKLGDKVIARKSLTVALKRGKTSYHLRVFPNSRIWYGGNDYSVDVFGVLVYMIDKDGVYTEVEDLSEYCIRYQIADSTDLHFTYLKDSNNNDNIIDDLGNHTFGLEVNSYDSDIYLQLYKKTKESEDGNVFYDQLLDDEVIDTVDYSKIKGKDHDGISIDINDLINIPRSKMSDKNYIKTKTRTHIKVYQNFKEIPYESVVATATDISTPFGGSITVKQDTDGAYFLEELNGDVQIVYSITININDEKVVYQKVQSVNIINGLVEYELIPNIRHICYNRYGGTNIEQITFNIISGEKDASGKSIVPAHEIYWSIEGESLNGKCTEDVFEITKEIKNILIQSLGSKRTFAFSLKIGNEIVDSDNVECWCEPSLDGYNYTIDLSNPYIEIPKALNNVNSSDILKRWTENEIVVYLGGTPAVYSSDLDADSYPLFKVEIESSSDKKYIGFENNTNGEGCISYVKPGISNDVTAIHYKITIKGTPSDGDGITVTKSQPVKFTDDEVYKLISHPTVVHAAHGAKVNFNYTPEILTIDPTGTIQTLNSLPADIQILINSIKKDSTSETKLLFPCTFESNDDEPISIVLKNALTKRIYDYDDIAIVRDGAPGADGVNVDFIYGIVNPDHSDYNGKGIIENYETNAIKNENKASFDDRLNNKDFVDIGNIRWYDLPQGITERQQQEFISTSKRETLSDGTIRWTNYTSPKIHSQFGKNGKDGNGVEYIYTAAQELSTEVIEDSNGKVLGFKVTSSSTNQEDKPIYGTHNSDNTVRLGDATKDEYVLDGWFDDIPNLSAEHPNLYMSYRKKINEVWGPFLKPVRWNTYSTNLELIIDNDTIIIDDNSSNDTLKIASLTNVKAYYKGEAIELKNDDNFTVLLNEGDTILKVGHEDNSYFLELIEGKTLESQNISGSILYIFSHKGEVITRKQLFYVKDFSAGEAYKLMLTPNIIHTTATEGEESKYSWDATNITVNAEKVKGSTHTPVTFGLDDIKCYYQIGDNQPLELRDNSYPLEAGKNVEYQSVSFLLKKDDVLVDSLSLLFSSKGADGPPGVSPFVLNLTDDTDSVFVTNDSIEIQEGDTTLELYYKNENLLLEKLSFHPTTTGSLPENKYRVMLPKSTELPTGVYISYNNSKKTFNYKIYKTYYSGVVKDKYLKFPIKVEVNYDGQSATLNTTYNVNVFKDVVKRELLCEYSTIKVKENEDGTTTVTPELFPIKIKEYNGTSFQSINFGLEGVWPESCSIKYYINDDTRGKSLKDAPGIETKTITKLLKIELTDNDIVIDTEIIPVVSDGKDGIKGKAVAIRMCDKWKLNTKYYAGDEPDPNDGLYYTDVVAYGDDFNFAFYQAIKTHISTEKYCPPNTDYWHKVDYSALALTQLLLITNEDGDFTGGFVDIEKALHQLNPGNTGSTGNTGNQNDYLTDDGIILWAGSLPKKNSIDSANNATFSVTRSGVIKAAKGVFEGSYMPRVKDVVNPKISNIIDLSRCRISNDGKAYMYLSLDLSEITEGMNFKFSKINNIPTTKIGSIRYINKVYKNSDKVTWNSISTDLLPMNLIYLDLPTALYVPEQLIVDYHDERSKIIGFIQLSLLYDFSALEDGYKFTGNDSNMWDLPAYTYIDENLTEPLIESINNSSSSNQVLLLNLLLLKSVGLNLPLIAYVNGLTDKSTSFTVTDPTTYNDSSIRIALLLRNSTAQTKLIQYNKFKLLQALPFIGKTITLFNFPGTDIVINGIRPNNLKDITTAADTCHNLLSLCKYINGNDQDNVYGEPHGFILLRCNSYPLIAGLDMTYGFYIGWDIIAESSDGLNSSSALNISDLPSITNLGNITFSNSN